MDRKKATNKARQQSKSKENTQNDNRVYAFQSFVTNQYFKKGEYYTHVVGPEKSFNLGGKENITCYKDGKKIK